jgi:hypothetical protein
MLLLFRFQMELGVEMAALIPPIAWPVGLWFMDFGSIANAPSGGALFGRVKLGASACELCLNHVECAFNGYEPDVDRIDDAIASEEEG